MRFVRSKWAILVTLMGLSALPSPAGATVMVEVSLEDMVRDAAFIVRGRVIETGTQVVMGDEGGLDPYSLTTLQVTDWVKGPASASNTIVIRELGGLIGQDGELGGMWIDGTPQYAVGEEVVVFLEAREDGSLRTYAMAQGKFVVTHGIGGVASTVTRDTAAIAFANWSEEQRRWSGRMTISHGRRETLDLDTFLDVVRGIQNTYGTGSGALLPTEPARRLR